MRKIKRGDHEVPVGVINVPSFYQDFEAKSSGAKDYRSTTRDVRKLIDELKEKDHIEALIMDLRGNGGGHLTEATALSGLFIPGGPIVQLRETGGRIDIDIWMRDDVCVMRVKDTGVGLGCGGRGLGTGLTTLRERLRLAFGRDASLDLFEIKPRGVSAEIRFTPPKASA